MGFPNPFANLSPPYLYYEQYNGKNVTYSYISVTYFIVQ